jgi:alpha-beta hydrolase superfamily lysophospholipase
MAIRMKCTLLWIIRDDPSKPYLVFFVVSFTSPQVLAALCLLSPERFAGVILTGPMLGIEDEIRPHPIIESVLVHIVAPLLPTWPITPGGGEDSMLLACRDPEAAKDMFYSNDYGGTTCGARSTV